MRLLRGFLLACGIVGTLGLNLRSQWLPGGRFWTDYKWLVTVSVLLVTLGALTHLAEFFRAQVRDQRLALQGKVETPLRALLVRVLDKHGHNHYKDVGVHAFIIRRRWVWGLPFLRKELVRVGDSQLRQQAMPVISWVKGKGLIGVCWERNQDVGANLREEWQDLRNLSPGEWESLDASVRYNLSHKEYTATQDLGAIIASPIRSEKETFVGCVSVDSSTIPQQDLWNDSREDLADAAQVIGLLIS